MGGFSSEREISLRSGKNVTAILEKAGYDVVSIDVKENFIEELKNNKIEIAFNVLHGFFGEDGRVQSILEHMNILYTGSGVESSSIGMNKILSKQIAALYGVNTASFQLIEKKEDYKKVQFDLPWIVKPVAEGSSIHVEIIKDKNKIPDFPYSEKQFFVEKYIKGTEVTVGVLDDGKEFLVLPVLQLIPKNEFYDFEAKYTKGMTDFILPAQIDSKIYQQVQNEALKAHQALGCSGATRSDFIIDGEKTYFLEINTNPGMTDTSDIPAEAKSYGMSELELCERILASALKKKK